MPASPRVRSRYATSRPRAVQDATADDIPYSTSSGCATTHSTRRKASSANGGIKSSAMAESEAAAPQARYVVTRIAGLGWGVSRHDGHEDEGGGCGAGRVRAAGRDGVHRPGGPGLGSV